MENHKNIASLLQSMNIGSFQKCDGFHILKFKDHLEEIPFQTISRKCEFFQIYFSEKYNADIIIDNISFSTKNKTLISFLAPLQTLSVDVKSVETISKGYMLVFNATFLNKVLLDFDVQQKFPYFNSNYSPLFSLENNSSIFRELFEKLYESFQKFDENNEEIIRSYLNILLYESRKSILEGAIKHNSKSRAQEIAFTFESLIRKHSHSRHSLDFYAEKLNISTVYLSECTKKATNKTAKSIIHEYSILEASTLLLQTSYTIDQIADKLGFSATSNFINFFKKHTNCTPSSFRNQ
ncbi:helix-turn-helix domain-containing protein [Pontimicrobium sp. IMCC45349]|uniref:helix-turn-helix domain-containing protein n=1 Tax=Pontimicrobium sp. IMCC45349 TaxID=3391574 RepID=UPI0039A1DE84